MWTPQTAFVAMPSQILILGSRTCIDARPCVAYRKKVIHERGRPWEGGAGTP